MFYERFIEICNEKGEAPTKVVTKIGLTKQAKSHWKNGKVPGSDKLKELADYFDVSMDWLMGRTEDRYSHKSHKGTVERPKLVAEGIGVIPSISVYDISDPLVITADALNKKNKEA